MRKENQTYCEHLFSEGETFSSSFSTDTNTQFEIPNFAIQWKIKRDLSSNIIIDLIFTINQIQINSQNQIIKEDGEVDKNNSLSSIFFKEFDSFKYLLIDRNIKKIDRINIILKQEGMNNQEQNLNTINEFLRDLQSQLKLDYDVELIISSNFNWNGIDLEFITSKAYSLIINDIYSYFPLSNFKCPQLKKLAIVPHNAIIPQQKLQNQSNNIQELEKDFEQFLCSAMIKQINSLKIDGNKYPSLIRILLSHLLKMPEQNLVKIELSISLDPRQFHLILSLSHLNSIYNKCQVFLNFTLDFALLFLKQVCQQEMNNNNDEKLQSLSNFPYLFTQIMNSFQNQNIILVFKNLKSMQQLALFDRIRSHSDQILKNDTNIYLKYFKVDKDFQFNAASSTTKEDFSKPITSLIYAKYNKLPPFSSVQSSNTSILQQDNQFDDPSNIFKLNLNKPFLSLFIKTFVNKPSSEKLHYMIEDSLEIKKKSCQNNHDKEFQCSQKQEEKQQILKFDNEKQEVQQNIVQNLPQQKMQMNTFPFQPFSLFKSKQESVFVKKQQSEQVDPQKTKQIIQLNSEQKEDIFSTYFLPFQTNEVTSIELTFENTVFGTNYKELFAFISKCKHLKKLCLLNFCISEDFSGQEPVINNQRQKTDTQQALFVYSSVFQIQPRKANEKVIPDVIQSLRRVNLITFKFSTNIFFGYQQASRLLQTQENLVYFSIRDFSSVSQQNSLNNIPENLGSNSIRNSKSKSLQQQLSDAISETIDLNKYLLQFNFKNADANCLQTRREFSQIISFYLHLKKTLLYQIYASKYLLHSDTIKRKEIFNHLITKFYIQKINIQSNLNKTMSQLYV